MPSSASSSSATNVTPINNNIPYSQQEAIAIGYAQYALMHTLTQQFRVNYPAAFLHAAAASGYLPIPSPMMAAAAAAAAAASVNSTANGNQSVSSDKYRERRKQPTLESDNNNNHIQSSVPLNDQPYRRETYQTLLESSRLLGQQKPLKPVPIDLRKHNNDNQTTNKSKLHSSIDISHDSPIVLFRSFWSIQCSLSIFIVIFDFTNEFTSVYKFSQIKY